jgi:Tol biopolymer transport system component
MSTEIFVSYSNQDYERVMPLVERLRDDGVAVWVDEGSIDAATLWSESIVEAIAGCRVLIMMVSSHSTDSHNVVKEVMIASESKKTILPIYLEPAEIPTKLKYQLTGIQHLEWFDGGSDEVFLTLKDSLAKRGVSTDGKTAITKPLDQAAPKQPQRTTHRTPTRNTSKPSHAKNIALAALAIACVLLLALNFMNTDSEGYSATSKDPVYLPVSVPDAEKFYFDLSSQFHRSIAISPDGKWIAYISGAKADGNHTLWLHSIKDDTRTKLATSQSMWGIYNPFFSHDSRWLAIFDDGELKRYSTDTHEMNIICDEAATFGAAWGENNTIYFSPHEGSQLQAVTINSSDEPQTIATVADQNYENKDTVVHGYRRIEYLPGERGILFSNFNYATTSNYGTIIHLDLITKKLTPLFKNGFSPKYSKTGHIVYIRDNTLKAREFDISTLKVGDDEVTLISGIRMNSFWGNAQYSISQEGTLVYIPGTNIAKGQFAWIDHTGKVEIIDKFEPDLYARFNLNATGEKIAVPIAGERTDIHILDTIKGASTQITTKDINWWPIWSPNDKSIIFEKISKEGDKHKIMQINASGAGSEKTLLESDSPLGPDDWSSDGSKVTVVNWPKRTGFLDLTKEPVEFKDLASSKGSSMYGINFSPNGKWISFSTSLAGGYNCYIAPFDKPNEAHLISNVYQGLEPVWSPNGNEIYYWAAQGMYRVTITFDETGGADIGEATLLFNTPWIDNPGIGYAMHPSGEKFLVVVHEEDEVADHFNIVLNFDALIEEKFAELINNKQP